MKCDEEGFYGVPFCFEKWASENKRELFQHDKVMLRKLRQEFLPMIRRNHVADHPSVECRCGQEVSGPAFIQGRLLPK
jgi:hypothetical protein